MKAITNGTRRAVIHALGPCEQCLERQRRGTMFQFYGSGVVVGVAVPVAVDVPARKVLVRSPRRLGAIVSEIGRVGHIDGLEASPPGSTNRHPLALKAQRALIASDKSQGKVKASSAYEKGDALFSPGPGESPFLRG